MPSFKLVGANPTLNEIIEILDDTTLLSFFNFVERHNILKNHRFEKKPFTFSYLFFDEKGLIVLTGFKTSKTEVFNTGQSLQDRIAARQVINNYKDNGKTI